MPSERPSEMEGPNVEEELKKMKFELIAMRCALVGLISVVEDNTIAPKIKSLLEETADELEEPTLVGALKELATSLPDWTEGRA